MNFKKITNSKILLIIVILIAILLRIVNIVSEQIWSDEAISIYISSSSYNDFWVIVINDIHPPLYYILLRGWIFILGDSVFSCRLLSVCFSILILPFLYFIGKELKNTKFGLILLFLYSISPFSIYYANEIRSYSLLHFLFTVNLFIAIKILKTPNMTKNYLYFIIFGIILIYTHYMGILYLGILCFALFILNRKEKHFFKHALIVSIIIIISYIPWMPYAIEDALGGPVGYTGGHLSLINIMYYAFCFFLAPVPSNINNPYIMNLIIFTFLINLPLTFISIFSFFGFIYFYKDKDYLEAEKIKSFIVFLTSLIFGIPMILGYLIPNSFKSSNLIGGLTLILIIQSYGLFYLLFEINSILIERNKKFLKIIKPSFLKKIISSTIFTLLIINVMFYPFFRSLYLQKPDWDGCAKKLKNEFKSSEIIIVSYEGLMPCPLNYYCRINNFNLSENFYNLTYNEEKINEFFDYISNEKISRIWIIKYWQHIRDPNHITEKILIEKHHLVKIYQYDFRLNISLTLYQY